MGDCDQSAICATVPARTQKASPEAEDHEYMSVLAVRLRSMDDLSNLEQPETYML